MKRVFKIFFPMVVLICILSYIVVFKMPINVNTRNDEDIFKQNKQSYSQGIFYNGKEYTDAQNGNIFKSINEAGIEIGSIFENLSNAEKSSFRLNLNEGYGLEYIYDGNIKNIYPRKYKRIIDYIDPIEYLLIGDYYLLIIDHNSSSSHERLLKNSSIKMPEMKRENIEKIEQCIGIPNYSYSSENCEKFIDDLKSEHDLYNVERKELTNSDFIYSFTDEFRKKGNVDSFVIAATKENQTIISKAQTEIDKSQNEDSSIANSKIVVYYKIYFKESQFPFRLILTESRAR